MKIIGLDLSLTHTGIVILNNGIVELFKTIIPKKLRGVKRLYYIRRRIVQYLLINKPDIAVIEGYAYSPNAGRSFSIGELGGVIKLLLYKQKISYLIVAPTTLKKFTTGKGNSPKSKMEKAVYKNWNVEFNTEHEIDAFALAMLGTYLNNQRLIKTNIQKEAIKTVLDDKSKQNYIKEDEK